MKKSLLVILSLVMSAGIACAQYKPLGVPPDSKKGSFLLDNVRYERYIEDDTLEWRGKRIIVPAQGNYERMELTPFDIQGYNVEFDKYISGYILYGGEPIKVFLKEVVDAGDGQIIFSYYRPDAIGHRFYIAKHGVNEILYESTADEVWTYIAGLEKCPDKSLVGNIPEKLTETTVNQYYRAIVDCNENLFPKRQFGVTGNIGVSPILDGHAKVMGSIGVFGRFPCFDEYFSFRTELLYSPVVYKRHRFQMPLLGTINFNYSRGKTIPYFEAGLMPEISRVSKKNVLWLWRENDGVLENERIKRNDFNLGIILGAGIERKITPDRSLYLGVRFNYYVPLKRDVERVTANFIMLNASVNIF